MIEIPDTVKILMLFVVGVSFGSFFNVVIDRMSRGESIMGRSRCDFCRKKIEMFDLFPVISFFVLKGRCRYCKKKLSLQYPVVELASGFLFTTVYFILGQRFDARLFWYLGIVCSMFIIFVSDIKYRLVNDYILISFFVFSLGLNLHEYGFGERFFESVLSAAVVCLPIFLIYFFSREKAMGEGDVYIAAIMGFLLGWKSGLIALYLAFLAGAFVGLMLVVFLKKGLKSKIAFGPFLVASSFSMMFYDVEVWNMISKLFNL